MGDLRISNDVMVNLLDKIHRRDNFDTKFSIYNDDVSDNYSTSSDKSEDNNGA